jgi:hypothetical protein
VTPSPWQFLVVALAVFRLWRLLAQDDLPWLVRLRNAAVGARETAGVWTFRHPTVAHWLQCPWCLGAWLTVGWTVFWWLDGRLALYVALPFALSATVGLIAKRLDV